MRRFERDRYYVTTDRELELLGTPDALAKKRSRGEGPRYHKVGRRVLYLGADLNGYLDQCAIDPTSGPGRSGPDDAENVFADVHPSPPAMCGAPSSEDQASVPTEKAA